MCTNCNLHKKMCAARRRSKKSSWQEASEAAEPAPRHRTWTQDSVVSRHISRCHGKFGLLGPSHKEILLRRRNNKRHTAESIKISRISIYIYRTAAVLSQRQIEQQAEMPQNALCFLDMLSPSVLETGRNPLHLMILEHCDTQTQYCEGVAEGCRVRRVLSYIRNPFNSS